MNVINSSSIPSSGTQNHTGTSFVQIKRADEQHQTSRTSPVRIEQGNSSQSLLRKISSADSRAVMLQRQEIERILSAALPYNEKSYPPHFSVEKGRMMDIFA